MAKRIEITGPAKPILLGAALLFAAWSLFGQGFFSASFGFFGAHTKTASFRSGHYEWQGNYLRSDGTRLGTVLGLQGEEIVIDYDLQRDKGRAVLYLRRWPGLLYGNPIVEQKHLNESQYGELRIRLPGDGVYVVSMGGLRLAGRLEVEWQVGAPKP